MFTKTYTFHEFITLQQRKELYQVDKLIGYIRKNKKMYMKMIIIIAILTFIPNWVFATNLSGLDAAGNKILVIMRRIGYWVIAIKGISEVIKNALEGNVHGIGKTTMLYVIMYASLFFIPWALKLVEGIF